MDPNDPNCSCDALHRRTFLGASAGAAVVGLLSGSATGFLFGDPAGAVASAPTRRWAAASPGRLVVLFLRGGMDGLSAVVPAADAAYHAARPSIGIAETEVLGLDETFGLHPAMAPLLPLFTAGRLAFVHAVGNPGASRSHFDAQAFMEAGDDRRAADGRGWLGRHLSSTTGAPGALARAAALSVGLTPSLRGAPALVIPSVDDYGLVGVAQFARPALTAFHQGTSPVATVGAAALASIDAISGLDPVPIPGATGPLAGALGDVLALLGGGFGLEIITLDSGGWDTHVAMGDATSGEMRNLLAGLASDLAGFQAALDAAGHTDVTTVVMSEFGRRVAENGSGGLDHGRGGLMTVMGGGVAGGQVVADWPGLTDLDEGDLRITTDFRDVLWEVVRDRLGHPSPSAVLPDFTPTPLGLTA